MLDSSSLTTPVPRSTLYDSIRTGSYTAVFENLQSQMKSRDGINGIHLLLYYRHTICLSN